MMRWVSDGFGGVQVFLRFGDGTTTDALHLHRPRRRIAPVKPAWGRIGPDRDTTTRRVDGRTTRRRTGQGSSGTRRAVNDVDAGGFAGARTPRVRPLRMTSHSGDKELADKGERRDAEREPFDDNSGHRVERAPEPGAGEKPQSSGGTSPER